MLQLHQLQFYIKMSKTKIYCQLCLSAKLNNYLFISQQKIACEQCCHKQNLQNCVPLMGEQHNISYSRGYIELCYRCKTKSYALQCKQCLNKKFCSQCFQSIHQKGKFIYHQAQFSNSTQKNKSQKLILQYIRESGTSSALNTPRNGNDRSSIKKQRQVLERQDSDRNKIQQIKKSAEIQHKINQAMIRQIRQYWQQKIKETQHKFVQVIETIRCKQKEFIEVLQTKAQLELQSYQQQRIRFEKLAKQCQNVQALSTIQYFKVSRRNFIKQKIDFLMKQLPLNQSQSSVKISSNNNNRTLSYAISTNELTEINKIIEQMTVKRSVIRQKTSEKYMKKSGLEDSSSPSRKPPSKHVPTPSHSRISSNLKKSFQGTPLHKNTSSSNLFCQSPKNMTAEIKKLYESPKNMASDIKNANFSRVNPQKIRKMKSQKNLTIGSPQKNVKRIMINYK